MPLHLDLHSEIQIFAGWEEKASIPRIVHLNPGGIIFRDEKFSVCNGCAKAATKWMLRGNYTTGIFECLWDGGLSKAAAALFV